MKRYRRRINRALPINLAIVLFWSLVGCASRDESKRIEFARQQAVLHDAVPARSASAETASFKQDAAGPVRLISTGDDPKGTPIDSRIVVYTAKFGIVVKEVEQATRDMQALAEELGGYLMEMREDYIAIRVPAPRFHEATDRVEKLGQVTRRDVQAQDITEEYVDLEARLRNAKAVKNRLDALLGKAEDVKAALEVEKELARVTEEIERLQAKLEMLKNRVAFSTITATFERVRRTEPSPRMTQLPFPWLNELNPNRLMSGDYYTRSLP